MSDATFISDKCSSGDLFLIIVIGGGTLLLVGFWNEISHHSIHVVHLLAEIYKKATKE